MTADQRPLAAHLAICERCGAQIVWARTAAGATGPGGKPMPLDAYPNPAGNVAVHRRGPSTLTARVLGKDETHDANELRAMPHFATCQPEPTLPLEVPL